jgi:hypothetical protein
LTIRQQGRNTFSPSQTLQRTNRTREKDGLDEILTHVVIMGRGIRLDDTDGSARIRESSNRLQPLRAPVGRRKNPLTALPARDERRGGKNFGGTTESPAGSRKRRNSELGSGMAAWGKGFREGSHGLSGPDGPRAFSSLRPSVFEWNGLLGCMLEGKLCRRRF